MTFMNPDYPGEFDMIRKYFKREGWSPNGLNIPPSNPYVLESIGDDCALLNTLPAGEVLAITSDMLVEGRHFFTHADPYLLGHKSLAVNLSDLAAMGAKPIAYSLSIALPEFNRLWVEQFATGLHQLADQYVCTLIGGDTTAGPLTISITAYGSVPQKKALRRSTAKVGDDIWLSNTVGDARFILGLRRGEWQIDKPYENMTYRMDAPIARIELGQSLIGLANAAIDISDGLLGDLLHLLQASHVGAQVWIDAVPHSSLLEEIDLDLRRLCVLRGGDDYELCFTAPKSCRPEIMAVGARLNLPLTRIGVIQPSVDCEDRLVLLDQHKNVLAADLTRYYSQSFDHFRTLP
jgi:thiamine-monophosphate kinase